MNALVIETLELEIEKVRAERDFTDRATRLRERDQEHGLSDLRLAPDGTVFVHVEREPGYGPVLRFGAEAAKLLKAEPNVVTDDTAVARAKLPTSSTL
ncbi:MAG: hypothetical protein ACYDD4_01615 [Acidimicrobiales bacterium]